ELVQAGGGERNEECRGDRQGAGPEWPARSFESGEGRRGAGETDEDGGVQADDGHGRLAQGKQPEPMDVAVEDAQRDDALRAEIGSLMRGGYGHRSAAAHWLPVMLFV